MGKGFPFYFSVRTQDQRDSSLPSRALERISNGPKFQRPPKNKIASRTVCKDNASFSCERVY